MPVLDNSKPTGVLSDRDVALALAEYGERLSALPVSKIMSEGAVTVAPEAPLAEVVEKFGEKSVRRLLVVDADGHLVGIIGWSDVAPHVPDRTIGRAVTEVVESA